MNLGIFWCVLVLAIGSDADKWRWPEPTGSAFARIDTKIGFVDQGQKKEKTSKGKQQNDELPFQEPLDTEGFYNRPPGNGRFPVRVEGQKPQQYPVDGHAIYPLKNDRKNQNYATLLFDGTVDSLHYCQCINTPECNPKPNSEAACGAGRYLCCYKRPNKGNTEYLNEVEDQRPMLLPGREKMSGFFGPFALGHNPPQSVVGVYDKQQQPGVLVGPGGPTGVIGPQQKPDVLVGPERPTGIIGPKDDTRRKYFNEVEDQRPMLLPGHEKPSGFFGPFGLGHNPSQSVVGVYDKQQQPGVLVGPGGPTGVIGPQQKLDILVGPEGPTGIIGPKDDTRRSESAQRGVLVGPGGPTGIIGPAYGRRPILVGPGGPTGVIGLNKGGRGPGVLVGPGDLTGIIGSGYGRLSSGVLKGPSGPTGIVDPRRPVLVGPEDPPGQIGPVGYYG